MPAEVVADAAYELGVDRELVDVIDDVREVFMMALRVLGYSGNTRNETEIEAAVRGHVVGDELTAEREIGEEGGEDAEEIHTAAITQPSEVKSAPEPAQPAAAPVPAPAPTAPPMAARAGRWWRPA